MDAICLKIGYTQLCLLPRLLDIGDYVLTLRDVNIAMIMHSQCAVCPTMSFPFFHPDSNIRVSFRLVLLPWTQSVTTVQMASIRDLEARWSLQCLKQPRSLHFLLRPPRVLWSSAKHVASGYLGLKAWRGLQISPLHLVAGSTGD